MGDKSAIQWTDATWNTVTGCTQLSPGCAGCYISSTPPFRIAGRTFVRGHIPLQFHEDRLDWPLRWQRPRMVFVNSLSDLFHQDVPDAFIDRVYARMVLAPQHIFQVLTKRADRMYRYFSAPDLYDRILRVADHEIRPIRPRLTSIGISDPTKFPARWIWLGVTIENQRFADERLDWLRSTPAAVRWVSVEPGLQRVDLFPHFVPHGTDHPFSRGIHWAVFGGESKTLEKPNPRPYDIQWMRDGVAQCRAAGVAPFCKQAGDNAFDRGVPLRLKAKKGGDPSEWGPGDWPRDFPRSFS